MVMVDINRLGMRLYMVWNRLSSRKRNRVYTTTIFFCSPSSLGLGGDSAISHDLLSNINKQRTAVRAYYWKSGTCKLIPREGNIMNELE